MKYNFQSLLSLNKWWQISILPLIALTTACTTTTETHSPAPLPSARTAEQQGAQNKPVTSGDLRAIFQEIRLIELGFSKLKCSEIMEHARRLENVRGRDARDPLSGIAGTAIIVCAAELNPTDKEKSRQALIAIEQAQRTMWPMLDFVFLENLRARRFLALQDRDGALKSKLRVKEYLTTLSKSQRKTDIEILELNSAMGQLNDADRAKLREIAEATVQDEKLFLALGMSDEFLSRLQSGEGRNLVLSQRESILSRIEQLFALESAQVEQKLATSREAEAREQANEMKRRFPAKNYSQRIDALVGQAAGAPTGVTNPTPSAPIPVITPPPTESMSTNSSVSDEILSERAITDAKSALDSGNPAKAVDLLDGLPKNAQTGRTKRLRREAAEKHVSELRARVRDIYVRSQSQSDKQLKLDALRQSKQTLELILSKYPDTSVRSAVERNLRSITQEIEDLGKTK